MVLLREIGRSPSDTLRFPSLSSFAKFVAGFVELLEDQYASDCEGVDVVVTGMFDVSDEMGQPRH
jgi:hypothetical protein